MWNQRGSWEICANPLSFLDFELDNYFCISSLLSRRLGFSSPTGAMGSWAYHVWNVFFLLKQSPNHNAVPSKCGVNCCHPACRDTTIAHPWECRIYSQQGLGGSSPVSLETCGFSFPVGQPLVLDTAAVAVQTISEALWSSPCHHHFCSPPSSRKS